MSVGVEERGKKGEAREREQERGEQKSLLLINGGHRRGVFRPRVGIKRGRTPTAGLHTVNTAKGTRQRSSVEMRHAGEHVGKLCFLAHSQSTRESVNESLSQAFS